MAGAYGLGLIANGRRLNTLDSQILSWGRALVWSREPGLSVPHVSFAVDLVQKKNQWVSRAFTLGGPSQAYAYLSEAYQEINFPPSALVWPCKSIVTRVLVPKTNLFRLTGNL